MCGVSKQQYKGKVKINGYKDKKTPVFHFSYLWKHRKSLTLASREHADQLSAQQ